jgi:hypothetical protein
MGTPSSAPADVVRLLSHAARREVERLKLAHSDVNPNAIAEHVVFAHSHLLAARAYRAELISNIADLVRELRASPDQEVSTAFEPTTRR